MQIDYLEQFSNAGKTSYSFMQELGVINSKTLQKFTELQFNFASLQLENTMEQLQLLGKTDSYKKLLSTESELVGEYGSRTMDFARKAASILAESGEDLISLFDKGFESKVKTVEAPVRRTAKKTS
jgi:Phasin protein.